MQTVRSEIFETGNPHIKSARIVINVSAKAIFDILANPYHHPDIDGSGTLRGGVTGPERLYLGAKFGMDMKIKVRYRILNTVMEFEENKRIAWCHLGRHRWRYELREITPNQTEVTESFDGTFSVFPLGLRLMNAYKNNQIAVAKTLVKLKNVMETR